MKIKPELKSKCLSAYRRINMYRFVKFGRRLAEIKRRNAASFAAESEASDGS
jgi:hypothetical protein